MKIFNEKNRIKFKITHHIIWDFSLSFSLIDCNSLIVIQFALLRTYIASCILVLMSHQNILGRLFCPILGVHTYCDSPCVQFEYIHINVIQTDSINIGSNQIECIWNKHGTYLSSRIFLHPWYMAFKMGTHMFSLPHWMDVNFINLSLSMSFSPPKWTGYIFQCCTFVIDASISFVILSTCEQGIPHLL